MSDGLGQTDRSQIARLRRLAVKAMANYDVAEPRIELVAHGENTTYRVISSDDRQYLLRIHCPNRHGHNLDSEAAIRSELAWLVALRSETPLEVPEPVRAVDAGVRLHRAQPENRAGQVARGFTLDGVPRRDGVEAAFRLRPFAPRSAACRPRQ